MASKSRRQIDVIVRESHVKAKNEHRNKWLIGLNSLNKSFLRQVV